MKKIWIKKTDTALIAQSAQAAFPNEACGVLIGTRLSNIYEIKQVLEYKNAHPSRIQDRFEIAPRDLIAAHKKARAAGLAVLGHFHSHPNGRATPSEQDISCISDPEALWLIQSVTLEALGQLNGFVPRANGQGFKTLEVVVLDA